MQRQNKNCEGTRESERPAIPALPGMWEQQTERKKLPLGGTSASMAAYMETSKPRRRRFGCLLRPSFARIWSILAYRAWRRVVASARGAVWGPRGRVSAWSKADFFPNPRQSVDTSSRADLGTPAPDEAFNRLDRKAALRLAASVLTALPRAGGRPSCVDHLPPSRPSRAPCSLSPFPWCNLAPKAKAV